MRYLTSNYSVVLLIVALFLLNTFPVNAKQYTITVKNYTFTPSNLTHVRAHDTINWEWAGGDHTTTSTTIPNGALDWDQPISSSSQTYRYIPTVNGTYHYVCTIHAAMGMEGSFVVSGASGIPQIELPGARVYPVPFSDKINIVADQGVFISTLKVFNLNGQMIRMYNNIDAVMTEKTEIRDLKDLTPGTYLFSFTTRDNRTFARRVIHN